MRAIVEDAASAPEGSEERKFGDLYASFMDAERAELLGCAAHQRDARGGSRRQLHSGAAGDARAARAARNRGSVPALRRHRPWQPAALPGRSSSRRLSRCRTRATTARSGSLASATRSSAMCSACSSWPDCRTADMAAERVFALETAVAGTPLGQRREPRQREDLQPRHLDRRLVAGAGPSRVAGGPRPARRRLRRDRAPPAELRCGAGRAAHRRPPPGVAGLAVLAGHPRRRRVPVRGVRPRRTSTSTANPDAAPPSCASVGSAASR